MKILTGSSEKIERDGQAKRQQVQSHSFLREINGYFETGFNGA